MGQPCSLLCRELRQDMNFPALICSSLAIASSSAPRKLNHFTWDGIFNFEVVLREKELIQDTTNEDPGWCLESWRGWQCAAAQGPTAALQLPSSLQAGLLHWNGWRLRRKIVFTFSVKWLLLWELSALVKPLHLPEDIMMSVEVWEIMVPMTHTCPYED